jgi:outer membrane biogenesis lipoprotein LolB
MRIAAALLIFACLSACSAMQSPPEQAFGDKDSWRQQQAVLDAQAIMQGMAQARQRAQEQARSSR